MVVHLLLHRLGLAGDHLGQRTGTLGGFGQHHRDRRLQRMRQVAHVRALALHRLLVMAHQGVQFVGQGLEFGGIVGAQLLGLAAAHVAYLALQPEDGAQADAHLDHDGADQSGAEQGERRCGGRHEVAHVAVHRPPVLGGHEDHRLLVAVEGGPARQHAHPLPRLRAFGVEGDGPAGVGLQAGDEVARRLQLGVEERARGQAVDRLRAAVRRHLGDLPVAAR
ncbi:hypothetical protein [Phenylobacterium sp. J426]|uniref:hypothetical protein n=1 Tax=Phenylobacterium sp. J426 TaxID=2898439 RepID=UPI0027E2EA8B|nr:hypothetical protein [Phenylobacterium sp. J426]